MDVLRTEEQPLEAYAAPEIVDYGNLVDVTAHDHPPDLPHDPLHPVHPSFSS